MSQNKNSDQSNYILQIKNLEKIYPNGFKALKNVSFNVKQGEFLVVIGLSGSGKSTLLKCINRLLDPTDGEIMFYDTDIAKLEGGDLKKIRSKIAMIFQHFNLVERSSVIKNVLFGGLSRLSFFQSLFNLANKKDKARANELLKLVGIEDKAFSRVSQLSGGQKQRVAIAKGLMQEPKLILADEPVASLDPATCHVVLDYLKKINQEMGVTVICNLHFLSLVRQYATRVIALKAGEIVFEGTPEGIDQAWFEKIYGDDAKEVRVK